MNKNITYTPLSTFIDCVLSPYPVSFKLEMIPNTLILEPFGPKSFSLYIIIWELVKSCQNKEKHHKESATRHLRVRRCLLRVLGTYTNNWSQGLHLLIVATPVCPIPICSFFQQVLMAFKPRLLVSNPTEQQQQSLHMKMDKCHSMFS